MRFRLLACRITNYLTPAMAGLAVLTMVASTPARAAGPSVVVGESRQQPVVEEVRVSGSVISPQSSRLSPQVAGRVARLMVDIGSRVSAGDVILELDAALVRIEGDAARAAAAQAREILADAQRREADGRRLVKSRTITATSYEALQSEVRANAAALRLREAEQRAADERLKQHVLRAPFAGVISAKLTEVGEWITPGTAAVSLVADEQLSVDLQVPQRYFPRLDRDVPVELHLPALDDRAVEASITAIVPVSDADARSFRMRVTPVENGLPLTPGMSASATLRLGSGREGVLVSRDALLRHPDGRVTVWVLEGAQDGEVKVSERVVKTGLSFDGLVEIRDGLTAGERVVVEGNESLRNAQTVTVAGAR
ncbi:efflux RND transporter periplasmic adaptor subunit [Nitrogeniibacter aestuarii]|uniref:efflux RND transporter periplasmic adaptor subunit n=1 Tax=Nitrogeniibacter aestuarii TaxID=2815343 RepID=UPI001D10EBBC|nr:efflux RND transporter periplasmic adaptor subunit [Nitrogeniibacter aestuarii]